MPSWVVDGQINSDHLGKVKEICAKLSLTPVGFVVLSEAIAHHKKSSEGSPFTGVVIGVTQDFLDITLFRFGNIFGNVNVPRTVSFVNDVVDGLVKFGKGEAIPS